MKIFIVFAFLVVIGSGSCRAQTVNPVEAQSRQTQVIAAAEDKANDPAAPPPRVTRIEVTFALLAVGALLLWWYGWNKHFADKHGPFW
jgi:hypothetical protein